MGSAAGAAPPTRSTLCLMTSLSYILRVLWLTNPTRSSTPAAAESIIEAVEVLEEDLREARADIEKLRLLHEDWLLRSRTTRRKSGG